MNKLVRFARLNGTIDRGTYLAAGSILFFVKFLLDSAIARALFQHEWSLANYLAQEQVVLFLKTVENPHGHWGFLLTMLFTSLPFVHIGVCLTLQRIRSANFPLWLVMFFFVPYLNVMLFGLLCFAPPQHHVPEPPPQPRPRESLGGFIPRNRTVRALVTMIVTSAFGLFCMGFSIYALKSYGAGLFVALPFGMGAVAALLFSCHNDVTTTGCVFMAISSVVCAEILLLLFAWEGGICLVMAFPLLAGCAALGAIVGRTIRAATSASSDTALMLIVLLLLAPMLMGVEYSVANPAPTFAVGSQVTIRATPEEVWNHVVSFPQLDEPTEWLFQTGVAYPTSATITGEGVGAVRRCRFSTGDFVEPITVWNAPHLLRFSVTENPPPMREWSLHSDVHPPHLDGFMISKQGQFLLDRDHEGNTVLQGTTWYSHNMAPATYWRLWSDYFIHTIHLRVLKHIEDLVELDDQQETSTISDSPIG